MSKLDAYLAKVRQTLTLASHYVPQESLSDAHSLIAHGEPAEGVRYIAWAIANADVRVPRELILSIYELTESLVGDEDLPPDLWELQQSDHPAREVPDSSHGPTSPTPPAVSITRLSPTRHGRGRVVSVSGASIESNGYHARGTDPDDVGCATMMDDYRLLLVSSVGTRDGMALELDSADGEQIAEIFEDKETKQRSVTFFVDRPVPLEVIEWLLDRARTDL